jgi:hypothetical protein
MPYTKCPTCRKVQLVSPKLMSKKIGCMGERCNTSFKAEAYRLHSNRLSMTVFFFFIGFAVFLLGRWMWFHALWMIDTFG